MTEQLKVYYLAYHDSEADDRRGASTDYADDYGVWFTEALAQAKADELNARDIAARTARRQAYHAAARQKWAREKLEHDTLHKAGLRTERFGKPEPAPQPERPHGWGRPLLDAEGNVLLHDYYYVSEFDLNEETP